MPQLNLNDSNSADYNKARLARGSIRYTTGDIIENIKSKPNFGFQGSIRYVLPPSPVSLVFFKKKNMFFFFAFLFCFLFACSLLCTKRQAHSPL